MAKPIKMRATLKDGVTEVRVLMQHVMETGRRKDEEGKLVPAWYITDVTVWHEKRVVLEGQFGTAVSKDPYLIFRFNGGNPGDRVSIRWQDNTGDSALGETEIVQ